MSPLAFRTVRPDPSRRPYPRHARRLAGGGLTGLVIVLIWLPPQAQAAPADGAQGPGPDQGHVFADFASSTPGTDYDHRTVTLTGRLLRHDPLGGPDLPATGEQVVLTQAATTGAAGPDAATSLLGTVTTGPLGWFQLADAGIVPPADAAKAKPSTVPVFATYNAQPNPDQGPGGGGQTVAEVDLTVTPEPGRLTMDYKPGSVKATGRTITAEGIVERRTAGGWAPAAAVPVSVGYATADGVQTVHRHQPTAADGRFSVAFTAIATGVASTTADWTADPYLFGTGPGGLDEFIDVARPTTPPPTTSAAPTVTTPPARRGPVPPLSLISPASTAPPVRTTAPPAAPPTTSASPSPAAGPTRLAETGGGGHRASFIAGGSTLVAAGLVLAFARRRMRRAG